MREDEEQCRETSGRRSSLDIGMHRIAEEDNKGGRNGESERLFAARLSHKEWVVAGEKPVPGSERESSLFSANCGFVI